VVQVEHEAEAEAAHAEEHEEEEEEEEAEEEKEGKEGKEEEEGGKEGKEEEEGKEEDEGEPQGGRKQQRRDESTKGVARGASVTTVQDESDDATRILLLEPEEKGAALTAPVTAPPLTSDRTPPASSSRALTSHVASSATADGGDASSPTIARGVPNEIKVEGTGERKHFKRENLEGGTSGSGSTPYRTTGTNNGALSVLFYFFQMCEVVNPRGYSHLTAIVAEIMLAVRRICGVFPPQGIV
jgi:hypothetical protein